MASQTVDPIDQVVGDDKGKGGATKKTDSPADEIVHATLRQKILLALFLICTGIILVYYWLDLITSREKKLQAEVTISWVAPAGLTLKPGPPSFIYDRDSKQLKHIGVIDTKRKEELLALLENKGAGPSQKLFQSYGEAIDKLAYKSNELLKGFILSLFWVGGLSGVLGVQLRAMINFIGVACYKNTLDVGRWWPWYFLRPLIGFVLGAVAVLTIEAGIFQAGENASGGTMWWVSIAFLAGFGSDEFTQRLRSLTQTLFGQGSK